MSTYMKIALCILLGLTITLWSCTDKRLLDGEVEYLAISTGVGIGVQAKRTTQDKVLIDEIVNAINFSHKEPVKFRPDYEIDVKCQNQRKHVLVKGPYVNVDGRTYICNIDLGARLKALLEL